MQHCNLPLNKAQADASQSRYILEVNANLFLDASNPIYAVGRLINAGGTPGFKINAYFGARTTAALDPATGHYWVSVFARRGK